MLQSTNGSLVIVDANTSNPSVFWKGQEVDNVVRVKVTEVRVTLSILNGTQSELYADMRNSGIKIKLGK